MTTRTLPPDEWGRKLAGTELESVWHMLRADRDTVIVVEDEHGALQGPAW